jgi:ubiquitin carboxyl-terminal hydrolase 9/24
MEKEGRLNKEDGEEEEEKKEEPAEEGQEAEEPNPEPILGDCFEYTLAGVTVHSGTANAGHYWSYASTERDGLRPVRADDAPADHLNAKWMEFNDSYVRDWEVSQLKKEAFGGEQSSSFSGGIGISSFGGGWSIGGGGGSYGQSGYMLVYERKKKKPIKLCRQVPSDEPVEEGQPPATKEEIYEIDYNKCVEPSDKPNKIFNEVLELNAKLGFEQEVYQ